MRPTSLPKNFCPVSSFLFSGHWAAKKNELSLVFAAAVIGRGVLPMVTVGGAGAGGAEASSDNLACNSPASSNSKGGADGVLPNNTRQ